jgi:hypothetical protein
MNGNDPMRSEGFRGVIRISAYTRGRAHNGDIPETPRNPSEVRRVALALRGQKHQRSGYGGKPTPIRPSPDLMRPPGPSADQPPSTDCQSADESPKYP